MTSPEVVPPERPLHGAGGHVDADRGEVSGDACSAPLLLAAQAEDRVDDVFADGHRAPSRPRRLIRKTGFTQDLPAPVPLAEHGAGDACFGSDVSDGASSIDPEAEALAAFRAERGVPVLWQITAFIGVDLVTAGTVT